MKMVAIFSSAAGLLAATVGVGISVFEMAKFGFPSYFFWALLFAITATISLSTLVIAVTLKRITDC